MHEDACPVPGRAAPLTELTGALLGGRSAIVVGPAGIGKTSLVLAALSLIKAAGTATRAVSGTPTARDVPLAALSPLLATAEIPKPADGLELAHVRDAVLGRLASERTGLLLVDDAHLLDGLSSIVLRDVAATGSVRLLLVARDVGELPHALRALNDSALVLRLQPLDLAGTVSLIEEHLGDQVEARTAARLHDLGGGIPLTLLELLRVAVARGSLRRARQVWVLTGPLPVATDLDTLLGRRLTDLDRLDREALEYVTIAEPIDLQLLEDLVGAARVESLEERRLVRVDGPVTRPTVALAHPLYGEWLRAALPRSRDRRLAARLAAEYESRGGNPVRTALLRVEGGLPTDPDVLVAAGSVALKHDAALGRTLLRAAVDQGGGPRAVLALADLLTLTHPAESQALLATLADRPLSETERQATVALSTFVSTFAEGGPSSALVGIDDPGTAPLPVRLSAAMAHLFAGDMRSAVGLAEPIAVDPEAPAAARWRALLCVVAALATTGRLDRAIELADLAHSDLAGTQATGGFEEWSVTTALIAAHERRGDLDQADALAVDALEATARASDSRARPRMLQCRARVALLRGRPTNAARMLRDVVADLHGAEEAFLPWNLSLLAVADAMRGRPELATQALRDLDACPHDLPVYRPEQELARAFVLACAGDLPGARASARRAAQLAESLLQAPVTVFAWTAVARWGDPRGALPGVTAAADDVDGPLAPLLRDVVTGLVAADQQSLTSAAAGLETLGLLPLAADAHAAATALAAREGDARAEGRRAQRLRAALDRCEPVCLPYSAAPRSLRLLTARERDIAALAAAGAPDRRIAEHLGISVRTVQTHLSHVYAKTHTTGRRDLASLLDGPT